MNAICGIAMEIKTFCDSKVIRLKKTLIFVFLSILFFAPLKAALPVNMSELRSAAQKGNAVAQFSLAGIYYNGSGVDRNYVLAVKWLYLAAGQGFAKAQYNLGEMYYLGHGVEQNYTEAL